MIIIINIIKKILENNRKKYQLKCSYDKDLIKKLGITDKQFFVWRRHKWIRYIFNDDKTVNWAKTINCCTQMANGYIVNQMEYKNSEQKALLNADLDINSITQKEPDTFKMLENNSIHVIDQSIINPNTCEYQQEISFDLQKFKSNSNDDSTKNSYEHNIAIDNNIDEQSHDYNIDEQSHDYTVCHIQKNNKLMKSIIMHNINNEFINSVIHIMTILNSKWENIKSKPFNDQEYLLELNDRIYDSTCKFYDYYQHKSTKLLTEAKYLLNLYCTKDKLIYQNSIK